MTRIAACIDYETLGTSDVDVPLISVGIALCDLQITPFAIIDEFELRIKLDKVINSLRTADPATLWFWMQQPDEARLKTFNPDGAVHIEHVFQAVNRFFIGISKLAEVWSKGADFDIAITKYRCAQLELEMPWHYRMQRCYRTLEAQYGLQIPDKAKKHTAIDDAKFQLQKIWEVYQQQHERVR